jgi:hypothetical protein
MAFILKMEDESGGWYVTGEPEIEQFRWTQAKPQASKFPSLKSAQDLARKINERLPSAKAEIREV